jgi:hypothetical protein
MAIIACHPNNMKLISRRIAVEDDPSISAKSYPQNKES